MPRVGALLLAAALSGWAGFRLVLFGVTWERLAFLLAPLLLAGWSPASRRLFGAIYPAGMVAVLYDAMRFVNQAGSTTERIHLCDLRDLEVRLFGITLGGQPTTVHDWLQANATPALDLFFAIPYATFVFVYLGVGLFLWTRSHRALVRYAWCFFFMNAAGFVTYHLYPAAPPWYFHAYGCVVDANASAWEGPNLARVDAWLGVGYFQGMYARSSEVFGAMPSLHVAYPLVVVLEGWAWFGGLGRVLSSAFFVAMCVAAVYLDHHWIVDVVAGLAYGLAAVALVRRLWPIPAIAEARKLAVPSGEEEQCSIARS